jgi:hypothetical protein
MSSAAIHFTMDASSPGDLRKWMWSSAEYQPRVGRSVHRSIRKLRDTAPPAATFTVSVRRTYSNPFEIAMV